MQPNQDETLQQRLVRIDMELEHQRVNSAELVALARRARAESNKTRNHARLLRKETRGVLNRDNQR